ncbi:hypothetical protein WJX72_006684 [[Myrmecia] bisecta]|uniref:Isoamylase 1-3-like C-terminal domain-containing protein n=1 Tax=[Myrmecia] bisecta TaxID=41462 RepID=A0AAW1QFG8_9CHLO
MSGAWKLNLLQPSAFKDHGSLQPFGYQGAPGVGYALGRFIRPTLPQAWGRGSKPARRSQGYPHVCNAAKSATLKAVAPKVLSTEKFAYPCGGEARVTAVVERQDKQFLVTITGTGISPSDAYVCWGAYRASPAKWHIPDQVAPAKSAPDARTGGMRTKMARSGNGTQHTLQLKLPVQLAPIMLGFMLLVPTPQGKAHYMGPSRGKHFTVPVGVKVGFASPTGVRVGVTSADAPTVSVNFAVRSRHAGAMSLCLARKQPEQGDPGKTGGFLEVALDPVLNRTGDMWHIMLEGLRDVSTLCYGWRADGDVGWDGGSRFHPGQVMLDPYAPIVTHVSLPPGANVIPLVHKASSTTRDEDAPLLLGSLACFTENVSFGDSRQPRHPLERMQVLEVDIPTFTQGALAEKAVPQEHRGKYLGVLDRLAHIKAAGANAVLLNPVVVCGEGLGPMGRAPISLFAPEPAFASGSHPTAPAEELKAVVKALHDEGIEVLLQVEYCFTAEGSDERPNASSLRGLDAAIYYRGNGVLNCGHAVVRQVIIDSLRHWAGEYQVDGFCFVNAETLVQDRDGTVFDNAPLVEEIVVDPLLSHLKMIAWAADDSLLPRGGSRGFPHAARWLERNKRFTRDVVESIAKGQPGMASALATRLAGSADLFAPAWESGLPGNLATGRPPSFGLNAVSYLGNDTLQSFVAAAVPETDTDAWELRETLTKTLLLVSLLAQGMPLISQDSVEDAATARFVGVVSRWRRKHGDLLQPTNFSTPRDLRWHGAAAGSSPDWDGGASTAGYPGAKFVGYSVYAEDGRAVYVGINPHTTPAAIELPEAGGGRVWKRVVDTALSAPEDALHNANAALADPGRYTVAGKGAVVLEAELAPAAKL